jgi:F0F1-type ATP synthase gamma subunit
MNQAVKSIKLSAAVAERGKTVTAGEDVITEQNYIFEPSTYDVVDHLERSMMQITLSEVILESKLAQYASRFRAMTVANDKADEFLGDLNTSFARAKRLMKDERLKEVINGLRKAEA